MDCGVYRREALERASRNATDLLEREHTSLHVRRRANEYFLSNVRAPAELTWPELGLTLDTEADLRLLNRVVESLADTPFPTCLEMITLVRSHPLLAGINSHVVRKGDE
jgi:spore coat polysaccharide biosynthesis protein SpsF (cytidylyltransferase family)